MSDCCSVTGSTRSRFPDHKCPVNGHSYKQVAVKTIKHHIKQPWNWSAKDQHYYFCDDPDCDVIYYGEDDSIINKMELRSLVGVKDKSDQATICYCFGVSKMNAINDANIKKYVIRQTKDKTCDCEIRNPSGRCCLKDFPTA